MASSSSLITNAPILMMASKGKDAVTFIGDIENIDLIGQFTAAEFNENDSLIAVISENDINGRHLIYVALDPKNGLLYMIYEIGRSMKAGFTFLIKQVIFTTVCSWVIINSILAILFLFDGEKFSMLSIFGWLLFSFLFLFFIYTLIFGLANYKTFKEYGVISENIFKKLGFNNPEMIDLYKAMWIKDRKIYKDGGLKIGVFEYRKVVENDPYPSDYFDKKEE